MSENKRFRVNDLVKYDYSQIGEYIDENHTDRPLRNDEIVALLNEQQATINEQNEAIEYLKTVIRYTLPNQMVADVFKEIGEEYE